MKVVYIAGSMRSGTTLLCQLMGQATESLDVGEITRFWSHLARQVRCSCGHEVSHCPFWAEALKATGLTPARYSEIGESIEGYLRTRWFFRIRRDIDAGRVPSQVREGVEATQALLEAALAISGREAIVDSSKGLPGLMLHMIAGNDPVDIVHIVRDPRAVAASEYRSLGESIAGELTPPTGANHTRAVLRWNATNLALLSGVRQLGLSSVRLCYEDLATRPAEVVDDLAKRFDLTRREHADDLRESHVPVGNPCRMSFDGAVTIDRRWVGELTPAQQSLIAMASAPTRMVMRATHSR